MARNNKPRRVLPAQEPLWEARYRHFLWLVRCPETAADLLQELRLKVFEWTLKYGEPEELGAFAAIAADSVFMDWCRKKLRPGQTLVPDEGSLADELPDPSPDPHERLNAARWHRSVRAELDRSTESAVQRGILAAWGDKAAAVAAKVGSTEVAVRNYRRRLTQRLKQNPRLRELGRAA